MTDSTKQYLINKIVPLIAPVIISSLITGVGTFLFQKNEASKKDIQDRQQNTNRLENIEKTLYQHTESFSVVTRALERISDETSDIKTDIRGIKTDIDWLKRLYPQNTH